MKAAKERRSHRDKPRARRAAQKRPAKAPGEGLSEARSLLDHLEAPADLETAWDEARAESVPLPHKAELEARFGQSLDGVRVYAGPRTASLLDHLDAEGAARGDEVLLRAPDVPLELAAHEVAHILQAGVEPTAEWGGVIPAGDNAETAADEAAQAVTEGRDVEVPGADPQMRQGGVALFRRRDDDTDADFKGLKAPAPAPSVRVNDPPANDPEPPPAPTPAPASASASSDVSGAAESPPPAIDVAPATDRGENANARDPPSRTGPRQAAEPQPLPPGPDRRKEADALLKDSQDKFNQARRDTDAHAVQQCACAKIAERDRPFARGPPLDVPAKRAVPRAAATAPKPAIQEDQLRKAAANVNTSLSRGPDRAPNHTGTAQQRSEISRVERGIRAAQAPKSVTTPKLALAGNTGRDTIKKRGEALAATATSSLTKAREQTKDDFGVARLAPKRDPTKGHDTNLDTLTLPDVDLANRLPETTRDRIATDANAATLPLADTLVMRDGDIATAKEKTETALKRREAIDKSMADTDRSLKALCETECAARKREVNGAKGEIKTHRTAWQKAVDVKVSARKREGESLVKARRAHVATVAKQSNDRAAERVRAAETTADAKWKDATGRAQNKSQEGRNPSLWERGVALFKSWLSHLKQWVGSFLDSCRKAINVLLDTARAAAKAIVEAGRIAITATIEATRATLDAIADNLPGELGEIANRFRNKAHEFLDGVQANVDAGADALNKGIDTAIDGLKTGLDAVFKTFKAGLNGAIDFLGDAVASNPLMALLRRTAPAIADLLESGLNGLTDLAAGKLESWIDGAFEASGLNALTAWLDSVHKSSACDASPQETRERTCKAFEGLLAKASGWVDGLLSSPAAKALQAQMLSARDNAAAAQVNQVTTFLGFVQSFAKPLYEGWKAIEAGASAVMKALGAVGRTIWRKIAWLLGIDPNIDPLSALRKGIEALWKTVVTAVQPILDGLAAAWAWVRDKSPLGAFIKFIASLPALWTALTDFASRIVAGIGEAFAVAAETFRTVVLPVVQQVLSAVSAVLQQLVSLAESFVAGVMALVDKLLAVEFGIALLDVLKRAVARLAAPLLMVLRICQGCVFRFWRAVAGAVRNLLSWMKILMDIAAGIGMALTLPPVTIVTFLAGAVWLTLVPACFKAPILNFFLNVSLKVLRFLPEPANFAAAAIYHGLTSFLATLRKGSDAAKTKALDLFASIFGGNVKLVAGLGVGLLAGVWESTGGTVAFLAQAVAWLAMLPVKLVRWAAGLVTGDTDEPDAQKPQADGGAKTPADNDGVPDASTAPLAKSPEPPTIKADKADPASDQSSVDTDPSPTGTAGRSSVATGPSDSAPGGTTPPSATDLTARQDKPAADSAAERAREAATSQGPATAEQERSEQDADRDNDTDDDQDDQATAAPNATATLPAQQTTTQAPTTIVPQTNDTTSDAPPKAPALPSLPTLLRQLATGGLTKQDVVALLAGIRATVAGLVKPLAAKAAKALLGFLAAPGTPFRIGLVVGTIAGMLVVEIGLALLTGGASAAVTGAKATLLAARGTAKLASIVAKLSKALKPLFALLGKLKVAAKGLLGRVLRWLDDVVRWMTGRLRRFRSARPRAPPAAARPRAPLRPGRPAARPQAAGRRPAPVRTRKPAKKKKPADKALNARVKAAAVAGWQRVKAIAKDSVEPEKKVLAAARKGAQSAARGIAVRVSTRRLSRHLWTLRVTGRRGGKRASATRGRAWYARSRGSAKLYSAAPDQSKKHKRIFRQLERSIGKEAERESKSVRAPDSVAKALKDDIQRIEAKPDPRPLKGIKANVDEAHHKEEKRKGEPGLAYKVKIAPNDKDEVIWVRLGQPRYTKGLANWNHKHPLFQKDRDVPGRTWLEKKADFGPYDMDAPPWKEAADKLHKNKPKFVIRPEYARLGGSTQSKRNQRWGACSEKKVFLPERLTWHAMKQQFISAQPQNDMINSRVAAAGMPSHLLDAREGAQIRKSDEDVGKHALMMLGHRNAVEPRPALSSLAAIDKADASHFAKRHVVASGFLPSNRFVAWRAAFEQILNSNGPDPEQIDCGGNNAAFVGSASGMTAVGAARDYLAQNWHHAREHLLDKDQDSYVNVVACTRTFAVTRAGARHPESLRPIYLVRHFHRTGLPVAQFKGRRPLFDEDTTSPEWENYAKRNPGKARSDQPLTSVVKRNRARFIIRKTDKKPNILHGWYLHTMFPID